MFDATQANASNSPSVTGRSEELNKSPCSSRLRLLLVHVKLTTPGDALATHSRAGEPLPTLARYLIVQSGATAS